MSLPCCCARHGNGNTCPSCACHGAYWSRLEAGIPTPPTNQPRPPEVTDRKGTAHAPTSQPTSKPVLGEPRPPVVLVTLAEGMRRWRLNRSVY